MHRTPLLVVLALTVTYSACGREEPTETPPQPADTTGLAVSESATGHDQDTEIPSRTAEIERDRGSRPQGVMDFVEIGPGDRVADIFAGSGYFTYLLSQRVGPEGQVYAQGYSPGLRARVERGDLADATNVVLVDSLGHLPEGQLDVALIVRGYHLFEDPTVLLSSLQRSLAPGGRVAVIELRLGRPHGHDMETHRMGEQTVIDQFSEAGFELSASSDLLRNPEDDHTGFWEGRRHLADRMLLVFDKPGLDDGPATARTGS